MSCGCKNKVNQEEQTKSPKTQQQKNTETIKGAVTKIVEKYYSKKK